MNFKKILLITVFSASGVLLIAPQGTTAHRIVNSPNNYGYQGKAGSRLLLFEQGSQSYADTVLNPKPIEYLNENRGIERVNITTATADGETNQVFSVVDFEEQPYLVKHKIGMDANLSTDNSLKQNNAIENQNLIYAKEDSTIPHWEIRGANAAASTGNQNLILSPLEGSTRTLLWSGTHWTEVTLTQNLTDLAGSTSSDGGTVFFSQTLDTVPGGVYEYSFDYRMGITSMRADNGSDVSGPSALFAENLAPSDNYISTGVKRVVARSTRTTFSFRSQGVIGEFGVKNVQVILQ